MGSTSDSGDPVLDIRLLGGFSATSGEHAVPERWRLRKAKGLVKLLALAPGHQLHREQLMDLLWPELEPSAAANQLRKALHVARRNLRPGGDTAPTPIVRRDELISLRRSSLRVDLEAFDVGGGSGTA